MRAIFTFRNLFDAVQAAIAVFLITLGFGQLISTYLGLVGLSLVGTWRRMGYGLGVGLLVSGILLLPGTWSVLWWTLPAGLLTLGLLMLGGSFIAPPRHPDWLFTPDHPAHAGCTLVQIPDGDDHIPGFLLLPPTSSQRDETGPGLAAAHQASVDKAQPAVCIIPGAGSNKTVFLWRLVEALLAEGLIVLTVDPPGHGDYRHRPMAYPDSLSAVAAAVSFLKTQPGVTRVGVLGISLGGALAIRYLAENSSEDHNVAALVVLATPVRLKLNRAVMILEQWNTFRAPIVSLLREITFRQIWQSWHTGGYRSHLSTKALLELLNPVDGVRHLNERPLLLVYSHRDRVASPESARSMREAAPWATFLESKRASHVTLVLTPEIIESIARWLKEQLAVG